MKIELREDLASKLLSRFKVEEPRTGIHVSDLANPCLRKIYYIRKNLVKPTNEDLLRWLIGKGYHQLLEGPIQEIELQIDGITGTIDCLERDGEMLPVEFKSVRASSNKEISEYVWWLEQFQSYLKLFGSNTGLLYVLHLMGNWKPPTEPHLRAYKLWFTDKEISDNWHEMLRRKELLLEALRNNNPPDRTKFEWACKACSAKEICNGGEQ